MNKKLLIVLVLVALVAAWLGSLDCVWLNEPGWGVALSCRDTTHEKYQPVFVWRWS